MTIKIIVSDNGKYALLGEFEVGKSGTYEQRILVDKLSLKKAMELKLKYQTN